MQLLPTCQCRTRVISTALRRFWTAALPCFLLLSPLCLAAQQANRSTISQYSLEAKRALAEKNAPAAVAALEKLARLTPNDPNVQANLGTVLYIEGQYEQAAERFKKALKLDPKIGSVRPLLGICYAELGQAKEAIPLLGPAFRHPPNKKVGRLIGIELMDAYRSSNNNLEALVVSEELLKRYPNDPEILYRAGHLYGDRSVQIMRRLVKVAPKSPWKRMAFAEALEDEKRYDLAIIEYHKVIASDPTMPGIHYLLGRAILLNSVDSNKTQEKAMKEFQEALRQNPRNAAAAYELGEIYFRRGEAKESASYLSLSVKINPDSEQAQIALARSLMSFRKFPEALPHLRIAIQLDPGNDTAHFLLARVYKALGNSTAYQHEMELYQKYHIEPFSESEQENKQFPPASSSQR